MFTIYGGTIGPRLDLTIDGVLPVPAEVVTSNVAHNSGLGLKTYREAKPKSRRLAVVGGGPSIRDRVDEIRSFDGDVWAVNGAWPWCRDHGIDAAFFSGDPLPLVADWARGARRAILDVGCAPETFRALADADVYTFEHGDIIGSGFTVTCAPHLWIRMGGRHVTLFGCESCYPPNSSHAYQDEKRKEQLIVMCGGQMFLTAPDFYVQAQYLSEYIRSVPEFIEERSGGFLGAMVKDPEFSVLWVSQELSNIASPIRKVA